MYPCEDSIIQIAYKPQRKIYVVKSVLKIDLHTLGQHFYVLLANCPQAASISFPLLLRTFTTTPLDSKAFI